MYVCVCLIKYRTIQVLYTCSDSEDFSHDASDNNKVNKHCITRVLLISFHFICYKVSIHYY